MAKKTENFDLDDFSFDDDDLSLDGGFKAKNQSKARRVTGEVLGGFVSGLKGHFLSRNGAKSLIKHALPDGYTRAYEAADETISEVGDLYDTTRSEIAKVTKTLKRGVKQNLGAVENGLPPSIKDRLKNWSADADMGPQPQQDPDQVAMSSGISDVFGNPAQMADSIGLGDGNATNTTTQIITDLVRNKLTQDTNRQLVIMNQLTGRLVGYQDTITNAYQRKSLELKYKHYFVARKHLDAFQQHAGYTKAALSLIAREVAKPDIAKTTNTELGMQMLKMRFLGSLVDPQSAGFGATGRRILNRQKGRIKEFMSSMGGQLTDAMMGMGQMAGMGDMGPSRANMGGDIAGGLFGEWASKKLGKMAGKHLKNHPKLQAGHHSANFLARNSGEMANRALRSHSSGNKYFDVIRDLFGLGQDAAPKQSMSVIKGMTLKDMQQPAVINQQTLRTINEVIPGFLSRIHNELAMLRTKKPQSPLNYSFKSNGFQTLKSLNKEVKGSIRNVNNRARGQSDMDAFFKQIDPGNKLSDDAKRVIFAENVRRRMDGNSLNFFTLAFDAKHGAEVNKHFKDRYELTDADGEKHGKGVATDDAQHVKMYATKHHTGISQDHQMSKIGADYHFRDMFQKAVEYAAMGQTDELKKLKLLTPSGDVDREAFIEWYISKPGKRQGGDPLKGHNSDPDAPKPNDPSVKIKQHKDAFQGEINTVTSTVGAASNAAKGAASSVAGAAKGGYNNLKQSAANTKVKITSIDIKGFVSAVKAQTGETLTQKDAKTLLTEMAKTTGEVGNSLVARATTDLTTLAAKVADTDMGVAFTTRAKGAMSKLAMAMAAGYVVLAPAAAHASSAMSSGADAATIGAGFLAVGGAIALAGTAKLFGGAKDRLTSVLDAHRSKTKVYSGLTAPLGMPSSASDAMTQSVNDVDDPQEVMGKDIYIEGELLPAITAREMEKGVFFDVKSKKPIESVLDITGPVLKGENYVITQADFDKGLAVKRKGIFKRIVGGFFSVNGQVAMAMAPWIAMGRAVAFGYSKILKPALGAIRRGLTFTSDIYVKGDPEPKLLLSLLRRGRYYRAKDAKPVRNFGDLKGEIRDAEGNVVLSQSDIDTGLVDSAGKPFKGLFRRTMGAVIKAPWVGLKLFGKMTIAPYKALYKAFKGRGKAANEEAQLRMATWEANAKAAAATEKTAKLLEERLPAPKVDKLAWQRDKDGNINGSDEQQLARRKGKSKIAGLGDKIKDKAKGAGGFMKNLMSGGLMKVFGKVGLGLLGIGIGKAIGGAIAGEVGAQLGAILGPLAMLFPGKAAKAVWNVAKGGFNLAKKGWQAAKGLRTAATVARTAALAGSAASAATGAAAAAGGAGAAAGAAGAAGASAAAGAGAAGAAGAAATGGGIIASIFSAPVLLTAAAVAVVGYGLYKGYKYMTRTVSAVGRFRMAQYGWELNDEKHASKVMEFESKLIPYVKVGSGSLATLSGAEKTIGPTEIGAMFGIDAADPKAMNRWSEWFARRFKPVFLSHMSSLYALTGKTKLQEADRELTREQTMAHLRTTHYTDARNSPYDVMVSPFQESWYARNTVNYDRGDVNDAYKAAMALAEAMPAKGVDGKTDTATTKAIKAIAMAGPMVGVAVLGVKGAKAAVKAVTAPNTPKTSFMTKAVKNAFKFSGIGAGVMLAQWAVKKLTSRGERQDRFQQIMAAAAQAGDPHPPIAAAIWALETLWGAEPTGKNNLFRTRGIANDGHKSSMVKTEEGPVLFRDFDSEAECLADRIAFINSSPKYQQQGYFKVTTPAAAAAVVQSASGTADAGYGDRLLAVISGMGIDPKQPSNTWSAQTAVGRGGAGNKSILDRAMNAATSGMDKVKSAVATAAAKGWDSTKKALDSTVGFAYRTVVAGASAYMEEAGNAISKVGDAVGGMFNGTLSLTSRDIMDLAKVTTTEVALNLKGQEFDQQAAAVIDTILNRIAANVKRLGGNTMKGVINAKYQFSAISGGRGAYGSIDKMPDSAVNKRVYEFVVAYLKRRAGGQKSIIGGHLNYANPTPQAMSQASSSTRVWVNKLAAEAQAEGLVFGHGNFIHVHGTVDDLVRHKPGAFKIVIGAVSGYDAGINDSARTAKNGLVDATKSVAEKASNAGTSIKDATVDLGNKATSGAAYVGNTIAKGANAYVAEGKAAVSKALDKAGWTSGPAPINQELIAIGRNALRVASGVDMSGMNKGFMDVFLTMVGEFFNMTGRKVQVNSAFRSSALQAHLYATKPKGKAARPGNSYHEFGLAIDINSAEANQMDKLGLINKYGFCRPINGEPWHLELKAVRAQGQACKSGDPARQAETANAIRTGGGSIGGKSVAMAAPAKEMKAPAKEADGKPVAKAEAAAGKGKPLPIAKPKPGTPAEVPAKGTTPQAAAGKGAATAAKATGSAIVATKAPPTVAAKPAANDAMVLPAADVAIAKASQDEFVAKKAAEDRSAAEELAAHTAQRRKANQAAAERHQAIVQTSNDMGQSATVLADQLTVQRSMDSRLAGIAEILKQMAKNGTTPGSAAPPSAVSKPTVAPQAAKQLPPPVSMAVA